MRTAHLLVIVTIMCGSSSCGSRSPAEPSRPADYAGQWSGPISQGGTIAFVVSLERKVVAITVEYRLNGCSGTAVLWPLSLEVAQPQLAPGSPNTGGPFDNPSFGTGTRGIDQPNFVGVSGAFTSDRTATGVVTFVQYAGCGSGQVTWSATKL